MFKHVILISSNPFKMCIFNLFRSCGQLITLLVRQIENKKLMRNPRKNNEIKVWVVITIEELQQVHKGGNKIQTPYMVNKICLQNYLIVMVIYEFQCSYRFFRTLPRNKTMNKPSRAFLAFPLHSLQNDQLLMFKRN